MNRPHGSNAYFTPNLKSSCRSLDCEPHDLCLRCCQPIPGRGM